MTPSIQSIQGKSRRIFALLAVALVCLVPLVTGNAQTAEEDFELAELRIAFAASQAKVQKLEASLNELSEKNNYLGEALLAANAEGDFFKVAYQKLRERIEAMGIAAIDPDPSSLQAQYIRALSDYRLTREENDRLADGIRDLSSALSAYMKTVISAGSGERFDLEVALRGAAGLVEAAARPKADQKIVQLQDARVISLKAEYDLAVLNVGRNSGVQVGMPFRIARKDRPIGHALVIDVRDHICGIIVEDLAAADDGIQLGDSAFVDTANQSTL